MRAKLGIAGLASVMAAFAAGCGSAGAGPLGEPKGAGTSTAFIPVKTHEFAVTAIPLTQHLLPRPAVLLGVRLLHPEDARRLTVRYAAKIITGGVIGGKRGWKAAARGLHPVDGFVVPSRASQRDPAAEVVIGAAAAKPGKYLLRGFILDYRIGGTHYSAPQQIGLEVCVSVRSC